MMIEFLAGVGDAVGLDNCDILLLLLSPFLVDENEDDILAILFLFHSGVQFTLALDGDGVAGVISAGGGVFSLVCWGVDGGVPPTAPSARSSCSSFHPWAPSG